jgi:hypothetical protein
MAKSSGLGQQLYVGGYDLSGDVGSIDSAGSPRGSVDKTGIGSSAMERLLTHTTGEITFNVHFNDAAGQSHVALSPLPTTDVACIWAMSSTAGGVAATIVGKQINYDWERGSDGDLQGTVQIMGSGAALEWSKLITAGTDTHASATSSTGVDELGAAGPTTAGIRATLNIITIASGTPTFVLEDSPNDGAYATVLTFTNTTERTSERATATGSVDRWLRVTTTGTFTNAIFSVAVQRGTALDIEDLS